MNLQHVNADILLTTKNRITDLQGFIAQKEADIQYQLDAYHNRREAGLKNPMTQAEFITLYPTPPATEEDVPIAAKKVKRDELQAQLEASTDPQERKALIRAKNSLQAEIDPLEDSRTIKLNGYHATKANPHRALTEEELERLDPAPTDADLAEARAEISAARDEINKLHLFLQSNVGQLPGVYDLDLLAGTAVVVPHF